MSDGTDKYPNGEALQSGFANFMHARVLPEMTRLTFGEQVISGGEIHFHTAVIMSSGNAKIFAELILKLHAEMELNLVKAAEPPHGT